MKWTLGLFAMATLLFGCGESRQEKFEKAMRAADVARTALDSAREEFASREASYDEARAAAAEAESELDTARQQLEAATTTWDNARTEVARWADDTSVSRVLQQRLLDDPGLETAAIAARVEQGIALLDGAVADEKIRNRAVEIARETPGVIDVQSQIAVAAPAAPPDPAPEVEPEPTVEAIEPELPAEPALP